MIDIKLLRNDPELVRENMRKKFQDEKVPLVDEVLALDKEYRASLTEAETLKSSRNTLSREIGKLMGQGRKDEAAVIKSEVQANADRLSVLDEETRRLSEAIRERMMMIPNIIDGSVPIGRDDSENVELERFGEPVVPDYEIPYHMDIIEALDGASMETARKTSGSGFWLLKGDIARLHSAVMSYARDFMIDKGFTYCIPPYMIRASVVEGVMSFTEMENMMYKIEGEDLYLIGTSEHSMIGQFIDSITPQEELPLTLTSSSPCFRREVGAHGIEERGLYRVHQFEKQEMVVICEPEDSPAWFEKMADLTVEIFRNMEVPVRKLECCSGDLADLKVKSLDVEAWSPRQQKYFEVGSCSNLGEAQSRRLAIRARNEKGTYFPHTLNNTVAAPPRMLISLLENHYKADGSIHVPAVLRPYMGGLTAITPVSK